MEYITKSSEETISLGRDFAKDLKLKDVIGLKGDLGTGKTQFVKGICEYFNVKDIVNSPTFILVNEYKGNYPLEENDNFKIYHFDLYRLKNIEDLINIGFDDYLSDENSICLIEWPELARDLYKGKIKEVIFKYGKTIEERIIRI